MQNEAEIWGLYDRLIAESEIVIDRPRGSAHPRYPEIVYSVDYGFLKDTRSGDGQGIDVFCGSVSKKLIAVFLCVDLIKRDTEIKLVVGCTPAELKWIEQFLNGFETMKALPVMRRND